VKAGQFGSFGKEILEGEYGAMFAGCAHESAGLLLVASSGEGEPRQTAAGLQFIRKNRVVKPKPPCGLLAAGLGTFSADGSPVVDDSGQR
jgi:hypothetical protein